MEDKQANTHIYKAISFSILLFGGLIIVQNLVAFLISLALGGINPEEGIGIEMLTVVAWAGMAFTALFSFLFASNNMKNIWQNLGLHTSVRTFLQSVLGGIVIASGLYFVFFAVLLSLKYVDVEINSQLQKVSILFVFALFTSIAEELPLRGYLLHLFVQKKQKTAGILFTSLLFAFLHVLNPGISFLALVNLFLVGIFLSLMTIYSGNIYFAVSLHLFVNFLEGFSGMDHFVADKSFALFSVEKHLSNVLIDGGNNGLTGSIVLTILLAIIIGSALMLFSRKHIVH